MSQSASAIRESVSSGENVLVLAPEFGATESSICMDLLTLAPPSEEAVLEVTVTQLPGDRVRQWEEHADVPPAAATVINIGTSTRSASSGPTTEDPPGACEKPSIRTVSSPSNLTRLGIEITEAVDELTDTDAEQQLAVCFHSLTPLLQYVSQEDLFKFVHLVTERFTQAGAIAHFHMDPTVHDEQTIAMFRQLVDGVLERDGGEWQFRAR
ncbi:DUF7504 family protein [Halomicrobium urmianum]|uniref:DUF7504 family protein n=1 Tax=Halomicrobium urmianum TaxID=1586233 RepID=UPI001CD9A119|nr:hypothetical protein [Halomicrobium urmianum]